MRYQRNLNRIPYHQTVPIICSNQNFRFRSPLISGGVVTGGASLFTDNKISHDLGSLSEPTRPTLPTSSFQHDAASLSKLKMKLTQNGGHDYYFSTSYTITQKVYRRIFMTNNFCIIANLIWHLVREKLQIDFRPHECWIVSAAPHVIPQ